MMTSTPASTARRIDISISLGTARNLASPKAADYFDLGASPSFARGVVEQAVREAVVQRRKFGLP